MQSNQWDIGYLFLGADATTCKTQYAIKVPCPTKGSAAFQTSRIVDAARNTSGEMIGRLVGRSLHKQSLAWERIPCETWWQMHRWFEQGHFTFYCHYFNHNLGQWETRLFYLGDVTTNPVCVNTDTGVPRWYENASFNVIDCGVI